MKKLNLFINKRQENWQYLYENLEDVSDSLVLPKAEKDSKPSWFGFPVTVDINAPFTRTELTQYLEAHNIQTRNLFAGNIIKHPCFDEMRETGMGYRVVGNLDKTEIIMGRTFWIGVYPGMIDDKLAYMVKTIKKFIKEIR